MANIPLRSIEFPGLDENTYVIHPVENLAPPFSKSTAYAVGDLVTYDSRLWKCKTETTAGDNWDSSKWELTSIDTALDDIKNVLDGLTYVPIAISSFSVSPSVVEIGSTVTSVTATYSLNKVPVSLKLDNATADPKASGTIVKSDLTLTADKVWKLDASDAGSATKPPTTVTKSVTTYFRNKIHFGVAASVTVDDSLLLSALATHEFATGRAKTFTVNAGANQYIWFACPYSFGTPKFKVGGFDGGFRLMSTFTHTNASGYESNYQVWRSDNPSLGSTTVEVS